MIERKIRTNSQIVSDLFTQSASGPMVEMIIMEALRSYTQMISDMGEPADNPGEFLNKKEWWKACKVINEEIINMYAMNNDPIIRARHARDEEEEDERSGDLS